MRYVSIAGYPFDDKPVRLMVAGDDVDLTEHGQAIADVAFRAMEHGIITWPQVCMFRDTLARIGYARK